MSLLGTTLKTELAAALGLKAFRAEIRSELRTLQRQLRELRAMAAASGRTAYRSAVGGAGAITGAQVRAARERLGESRKAFAARVGVSPSIVFLWESGRSTPRRAGIVERLRELVRQAPGVAAAGAEKRSLKLSPARRAALKLQGRYMGSIRGLSASDKKRVKDVKGEKGVTAAIALARKLTKG